MEQSILGSIFTNLITGYSFIMLNIISYFLERFPISLVPGKVALPYHRLPAYGMDPTSTLDINVVTFQGGQIFN